MNEQIINNLYEFWSLIGLRLNNLAEADGYKAVSVSGSDWPNRIYSVINKKYTFEKILALSQYGKLPEFITLEKPCDYVNNSALEFMFGQKNMSVDLKTIKSDFLANENIFQVKTEEDSVDFAKTASEAFGYRVDEKLAFEVSRITEKVRMYIYKNDNECLGCGIVYFDTNNNAGLHMIGTVPKGRGKGIGKYMTEMLLSVSKKNGKDFCVLHASLMGEPIYRKLGFEPFGELETYRILKKILS